MATCPSVWRLHRAPLFRGARSASSHALVRAEQTQYTQSLLQRQPLEVGVLSNGIRVVTQRRTDLPTVSVGLFRRGGSEQESNDNNGISGFFQRVQQRGTTNLSGSALASKVGSLGGRVSTINERQYNGTLFHAPKQHVAEGINMLADMARNPLLSKEGIEAERTKSLRVLDASQYDMEEVMLHYLHDTAFQGTSLGMNPLGSTDGLESVNQDSLRKFAEETTCGKNLCLAVAGDVDPTEVLAVAEKHLQSIPTGSGVHFLPIRYTGSEVQVYDDHMQHAHVAVGVEAPSYGNADSLALEAARFIIGGYDRSHGADARHGLCRPAHDTHHYENNTFMFGFNMFGRYYSDIGLWGTYMISTHGSMEIAYTQINKEWHRVRHRCRDSDVERAQCEMKHELSAQTESANGQVALMGKQLMTLGRVIPNHEMNQRIDNIHPDIIRSVFDEYFYGSCPVYARVGHIQSEMDYNVVRKLNQIGDPFAFVM